MKFSLQMLFVVLSMFFIGCKGDKPPQTPVQEQGTYPAIAPPPPMALAPAQPPGDSIVSRYFVVETDVMGHTLAYGELVSTSHNGMVFFRDTRMKPDCSNVTGTNLSIKSNGMICSVAFLPYEQGFTPGESRQAFWRISWDGGHESRTFTVQDNGGDGVSRRRVDNETHSDGAVASR